MLTGSMIALWTVAIAASAIGLAGLSVAVWQSAKPSSSYAEVSARSATFTDALITGNLTGPTIASLRSDVQTCTCGTAASSSVSTAYTVIQSGACVVALRVNNISGVFISSVATTYQVLDIAAANQVFRYRCINVTSVPGTTLTTGRASASDSFSATVNQFSPTINALVSANGPTYFMLNRPAFTVFPNFTTDRAYTLDYGYISYVGNTFIQATGVHIMIGNGVASSANIVLQMIFGGALVCPSYIIPTAG